MELRAYQVGGGVVVGMPPTIKSMDITIPPDSLGSWGQSSRFGADPQSEVITGSTSNGKYGLILFS